MITKQSGKNQRQAFQKRTTPQNLRVKTIEDIKIMEEWRVGKHDKGSIDVEIGFLSEKISKLEQRLIFVSNQNCKIEFYRLRKLLIEAVNNRRKKLDYLMNTDTNRYHKALNRLQKSA